MRLNRNKSLLVITSGLLLTLILANHSGAATVSLTISTPAAPIGTLTISAPSTFDYGTTIANSTLIKQMSPVTVTDNRGSAAGWVASVIASALTNGTDGITIIPTAMSYSSGTFLKTGTATLTENDQTNLTGVVPVVTETSTTGVMSATWTPTMTIVIPGASTDGVYTGTITHSVA